MFHFEFIEGKVNVTREQSLVVKKDALASALILSIYGDNVWYNSKSKDY